ncbi:triosephosphate isomerase [Arthrobacter sp. PvP102]|uniref:triose-phosphate isomerase family protein n=1 Tax=unclassified Arthrobacter TaxID=235627 RepID=UPI001AE7D634|nr:MULTISPECIES: triose-phosphate isomerase family protein [unclassified Arthrobacter]MBP1234411.1 triosephosphate isomerase [Arthrobacter sp. PvP103]MBP1239545.1 triosephosphate isomerase [Arthrobacter sp. PvP102]
MQHASASHATDTVNDSVIDCVSDSVIYVGVSTKMYLGYRDTRDWLERLRHEVDSRPALAAGRVVPFVIPSFPVLPAAAALLTGSPMLLGAQNCGWAEGPWTGEVAPSMLAELGVRLVEIGHAERRAHLGETDSMVALKVRAADDAGLTPLLCVGEASVGDASDADAAIAARNAAAFVQGQIEAAVGGDWELASRLIIAYEPVWAIGAAEPADPGYVSDVVNHLRGLLAGHGLRELPVIYGGSAKPGLLPELGGVSGLFLGRFAHDAGNFGAVLDEALAG